MADTSWQTLLDWLASGPRENGTPALAATAQLLREHLAAAGWEVTTHGYTAYPYEQRALGIFLTGLCTAYAVLMWRRRFGIAALLPLMAIALAYVQTEWHWRLSWFLAAPQENVVATLSPPDPTQRLLLTAHFDTKTDFLDHVARAPVFILGLPLGVLMLVVALASYVGFHAGNFTPGRRALARILTWASLFYGLAAFLALTAGAFVNTRSPGALDDGAGCAVLVRLAEKLSAHPPVRTEVQLVFFSGEEIGAQGARAFVSERLRAPTLPERAVNLDPIGASLDFAVLGQERALLRSYAPDHEVVALLDRAHHRLRRKPIPVLELSGLTDAWAFLAAGHKAATVLNPVPPFAIPRGLHSGEDRSERIPLGALDETLRLLEIVVREFDRTPRSAHSPQGYHLLTSG